VEAAMNVVQEQIQDLDHLPVKYEKDADPAFVDEISSLAGVTNLQTCIQCGTCSGTCPSTNYMDIPPHRIINLIRAGFREDVLTSFTPWLCASCYSCAVECPQTISITDVMYAIKQKSLQEKQYPRWFPSPVMVQEFFNAITSRGRIHEGTLILNTFVKTNPILLFKNIKFGFTLWRKGLLEILPPSIQKKDDLKTLLKAMDSPRE
jgi:quinone-modifying oxidoreductase subunit QmoC